MDDLCDTFTGESLLSEAPLDVVQNFGVRRIILVQDVLELEVRGTKPVAEVLSENPTAVCTVY